MFIWLYILGNESDQDEDEEWIITSLRNRKKNQKICYCEKVYIKDLLVNQNIPYLRLMDLYQISKASIVRLQNDNNIKTHDLTSKHIPDCRKLVNSNRVK